MPFQWKNFEDVSTVSEKYLSSPVPSLFFCNFKYLEERLPEKSADHRSDEEGTNSQSVFYLPFRLHLSPVSILKLVLAT